MIHSHDQYSSDYSSEEMKRCHEYMKALQEERQKVQVFQRELPLCLDLITQAIESCKQQLSGTTSIESSEQTSGEKILEEFILPVKKLSSSESDHQNDEGCCSKKKKEMCNNNNNNPSNNNMSDWLRLWNQTPDSDIREGSPEKMNDPKEEVSNDPFRKGKINSNTTQQLSAGDGEKNRSKKEGKVSSSTLKKERRCWSTELHRRFLQALQQLGGSSATPKQIRELMKVDGLTNDEVKSHLQKYRLHTKRPSSSASTTTPPPPPQFVVVGGIWVPSSDISVPNCNGIYPSTLPGNFKELSESQKAFRQPCSSSSHSDERNDMRATCSSHSDSPITSSSYY